MAALRSTVALLLLAASSSMRIAEDSAASAALPCTLTIQHVKLKGGDDGIRPVLRCSEAVKDGVLRVPSLSRLGRTVPLEIGKEGEELQKDVKHVMRLFRLVDDIEGTSFVGRTFVFEAKYGPDWKSGSVSATVSEPTKVSTTTQQPGESPQLPATVSEPTTVSTTTWQPEEGSLPCRLVSEPATLQGGEVGFQLVADCAEQVTDLTLKFPKGYTDKLFKSVGPGRVVLFTQAASMCKGWTLVLEGKAQGADGKSNAVTIEAPTMVSTTTWQPEEGSLPCRLLSEPVSLQGGAAGFQLVADCTKQVTDLTLKFPEGYTDKEFESVGPGRGVLFTHQVSTCKGWNFVLEGKAEGVEGKSNAVTI